jgi:hypothetical protein
MSTLTITVFQAFTFYASEDKLVNRGHYAGEKIGVEAINRYVISIINLTPIGWL